MNNGLVSGTKRLGVPGLVPTAPIYGDVLQGDGTWGQPRRTILPAQTNYPTEAKIAHWQITTDTRLELVVHGDSIAAGAGATAGLDWVNRIRTVLERYFGGDGGEGMILPIDTRATFAGWSGLFTLAPMGAAKSNNGATANVWSIPSITCDRVDVFYIDWDPSHADIDIQIDGGGYTTKTTAKVGDQNMKKVSHTFTAGSHTIDIRSATNANLFFSGIAVYNGTSGVVIHNLSTAGHALISCDPTKNKWLTDAAISPHLLIVNLGINDFNSAFGTMVTNLRDLFSKAQALTGKGVCDVLYLLENNRDGIGVASVYNIIKIESERAGVPWASVGDWWGSARQMMLDGRSNDGIHPTDKGHRDIAAAVWQLLRAS